MIRKAKISDLQEIKALTEACARAMIEKEIFQWNEHYPSLKKLKSDILQQELYLLQKENKIIGIIVLSETMDEEYFPINWLSKTENNIYSLRYDSDPARPPVGEINRL